MRINSHEPGRGKFQMYFPTATQGELFHLRVKHWTGTQRGGGDLQPWRCSKLPCMRSRATCWPCFEQGAGLCYGNGSSLSPPRASPPTPIRDSFFIWGLHLPQPPCMHHPMDTQGEEDFTSCW